MVAGTAGKLVCKFGPLFVPWHTGSMPAVFHAQGVVQSAFLYGYMATQLLGGTLADRFGGEVAQLTLGKRR